MGQERMRAVVSAFPMPEGLREHFGLIPSGYLDLLDERLLKLVSRLVETGLVTYGHPSRWLPVGGLRQEAHFQTIPRGADSNAHRAAPVLRAAEAVSATGFVHGGLIAKWILVSIVPLAGDFVLHAEAGDFHQSFTSHSSQQRVRMRGVMHRNSPIPPRPLSLSVNGQRARLRAKGAGVVIFRLTIE